MILGWSFCCCSHLDQVECRNDHGLSGLLVRKEQAMPVHLNVKTKINLNGKTYSSVEEMPPDVRSLYEKAIAGRQSSSSGPQVGSHVSITFNGQTFNSLEEMPADARGIYESVMAAVDKDGDGIPDPSQPEGDFAFEPSAPILPAQTDEAPSKISSAVLIIAILGLLFVLAGLALFVLSHR
jgi:hypothetical protein